MPDLHPCGSLPVSQWAVTMWYCHHHQAFFGMHSVYTEDGEDRIRQHTSSSIQFGPFDDVEHVMGWVRIYLDDIKLLPTADGPAA